MVMANGFNELNVNEMMEVDGGIDWGGAISGALNMLFGAAESAAGAVGVFTPEMTGVTKILGVAGIVDGYERYNNGWNTLMNAINE